MPSARETSAGTEKNFLQDVVAMCEVHRQGTGKSELDTWGGWWRNRFREDADKARRVLGDILSLVKERRISRSPGAAAADLWKRLP